jgi:hypothetical protein
MTKEGLFMLFSEVDGELVEEARTAAPKKRASLRWGVLAACLCLVAAGALTFARLSSREPVSGGGYNGGAGGSTGGAADPGGAWPEGVDPKTASIAVYPATERVENVADAAIRQLSEEEALQYGDLGRYLPRTLPEGYWFVIAEVYETEMKDGGEYHLLRATYSKSDPADFDPEAPYLTDDCFFLQVLDYLPDTRYPVYTPETQDLPQGDAGNFYLALDGAYIGVFPSTSRIGGGELRQLTEELLKN